MNKLIAFVGMSGSGKSVANDILEEQGWKKVYFGGITMDILKEQGLEFTQENEKPLREKLRKEHGMGAYAKLSLPKINELIKDNNVFIDGLYSWDEYKVLQEEFEDNIKLIAIIADKNIRYDRVSKREIRPLKAEEVMKRDIAEIENLAKGGPIAYADYYIYNNSDINAYIERLNEIINKL